jgi:hypothetical protein
MEGGSPKESFAKGEEKVTRYLTKPKTPDDLPNDCTDCRGVGWLFSEQNSVGSRQQKICPACQGTGKQSEALKFLLQGNELRPDEVPDHLRKVNQHHPKAKYAQPFPEYE